MQDKNNVDPILGSVDKFINYSEDVLTEGSKTQIEEGLEEEQIDRCISAFLKVNPFEFDDRDFIASTMKLDGFDFARAAYRVYLRLEC